MRERIKCDVRFGISMDHNSMLSIRLLACSQKGHTNTTQPSDVVCHSVSSSSAGNVHVAYDPGPANDTQFDKQGKQCFRKLAPVARSFP